MKFGLFAMNYGTCADPEAAIRVAQYAEAAGFESLWTGEHIVLPSPLIDGFSMRPTLPFLDTIVALTLIAANTTTIKVASGIIELPLHHPVLLAKQLASIDQISRGRLMVGIGAGYLEPEFSAMGVELSERGGRMDEHLDAMRALWSMPDPEFHGRHVAFSGVDAYPRTVSPSGPPIIVGGIKKPARRRAIEKANGWYLFATDQDLAREAVNTIRAETEQYQRPAALGKLELTMTPVGPFTEAVVESYRELGVERLVVLPRPDAPRDQRHEPVPIDEILRAIDAVAEIVDGN
ncbi:MAG: TIGR03619 family F420-dependent LLM class oxidoreductase [Ilumatobacteraceae bacterium]